VSLARRAAVGLLTLALLGCAETFDATNLGVPATLASPAGQPAEGERFRVTSHSVYGFWGLFRIKQPSLEKALAAQLAGGKAIAEVRVRARSRWSDVLITGLTLGLLAPRTVTYEGVVTK
jgi:hypothetical protein